MKPVSKLICSLLALGILAGCDSDERSSSSESPSPLVSADDDDDDDESDDHDASTRRATAEDLDSLLRRLDNHGDFSTFVMGMTITDSLEEFPEDQEFTFFVPNDDAFRVLLERDEFEDVLRQEQHHRLSDILFHHVLKGSVTADELESGQLKTKAETSVDIIVEDGEISYGSATVVDTDFRAANGIFHVLDEVVVPDE